MADSFVGADASVFTARASLMHPTRGVNLPDPDWRTHAVKRGESEDLNPDQTQPGWFTTAEAAPPGKRLRFVYPTATSVSRQWECRRPLRNE